MLKQSNLSVNIVYRERHGQGCRRLLAKPGTTTRVRVGEHLCVLLLVLAQHLRHGHQRLDLGHLLADVAQLGQVALAHVVHCGQVAGGVTLAEKRLICAEKKNQL